MPPQEQWESYFDPDAVLETLACRGLDADVLEFGCGYGTFTVAAAARTRGTVHGLDIDPLMVADTAARARRAGLKNVTVEARDFVRAGAGVPDASVGYVMVFNILHLEDPVALLREAHRVLEPGGRAGLIHWKREVATPRGPPLDIRPSAQQVRRWGEQAGFHHLWTGELPRSPWHWGMLLARPAESQP